LIPGGFCRTDNIKAIRIFQSQEVKTECETSFRQIRAGSPISGPDRLLTACPNFMFTKITNSSALFIFINIAIFTIKKQSLPHKKQNSNLINIFRVSFLKRQFQTNPLKTL